MRTRREYKKLWREVQKEIKHVPLAEAHHRRLCHAPVSQINHEHTFNMHKLIHELYSKSINLLRLTCSTNQNYYEVNEDVSLWLVVLHTCTLRKRMSQHSIL